MNLSLQTAIVIVTVIVRTIVILRIITAIAIAREVMGYQSHDLSSALHQRYSKWKGVNGINLELFPHSH